MDLLRSLPLGLYLEQPNTWLHRLDPRVKLAWLLSFLVAPILANSVWRIMLVGLLILVTLTAAIPLRVWRQQMGWLLMLSFFVLLLGATMPDGLGVDHQPRLPVDELTFAQQAATLTTSKASTQARPWYNPFVWGEKSPKTPSVEQSNPTVPQPTDYSYVLFNQGPVKVTRRSLDLAVSVSTLLFTLIYSSNLYLLTTAPEEITAELRV